MAATTGSRGRRQTRGTPYDSAPVRIRFSDRAFDARPDRVDFRDLPYQPPLRSLPSRWPTDKMLATLLPGYVRAGLILDQGSEGACTGFGLACVVNYLLWVRHLEENGRRRFQPVSPRMLYELARRYDEWPGERYEGSSCRGALKGWHKHGVCRETLWPYTFDAEGDAIFHPPKSGWEDDSLDRTLGVYYRVDRKSVVDMQAAVANIGAVYVSARVHSGWDALLVARASRPPRRHDDIPDIPLPKKKGPLGGHAFAIVGYDPRGFIVQNSWGHVWGARGFGRLLYADWVSHATDAWACALGVPADRSLIRQANTRWHVPPGRAVAQMDRVAASIRNPPEDPWPVDHTFDHRPYEPLTTAGAYERSLVTGNDGEVVVRDVRLGGPDANRRLVEDVAHTYPLAWFRSRPAGRVKLAVYAHGGLNDEDGSIARVRVLAPYFLANGIYPIFLVWRTGFGETIRSLVGDWYRKLPGFDDRATGVRDWLADQKDRALEVIGRPLGRGIWSEMRENAERSMRDGHGLASLVDNLARLAADLKQNGRPLDVHLVGHSAGAIMLGHLLQAIRERNAQKVLGPVASCTLLAPACSVGFAVKHYGGADSSGVLPLRRLWLNVLTDENEKRDGLPAPGTPLYGKSLLYLVSRALDDARKMPILGLARALDPKYARDTNQWADEHLTDLASWIRAWTAAGGQARTTLVTDQWVSHTRAGGRTQATHGSFDNNIPVLTETIARMRGSALVSPIEWLDY